MADANIIVSAGLFPDSTVGKVLSHVVRNHHLVLCKYTLNELKEVFERKFSNRIEYFDKFVGDLKYELIDIEITNYDSYPKISDIDDMPLLAQAIEAKVDILITGDKDFDEITIGTPKILKPRQYIEKYLR